MSREDQIMDLINSRMDRLEGKLDGFVIVQSELTSRISVCEEKASSLTVQFRGVIGALSALILTGLGFLIK